MDNLQVQAFQAARICAMVYLGYGHMCCKYSSNLDYLPYWSLQLELAVTDHYQSSQSGSTDDVIISNPDNPLGLIAIGIAQAARVHSSVLYFLLLPILLYEATQQTSWYHFRKVLKPGLILATFGVNWLSNMKWFDYQPDAQMDIQIHAQVLIAWRWCTTKYVHILERF